MSPINLYNYLSAASAHSSGWGVIKFCFESFSPPVRLDDLFECGLLMGR